MNSVHIAKALISLCGVVGCLLTLASHNIKETFKDYGSLAISHEEREILSEVPTVCHLVGLLTVLSTLVVFLGISYNSCKIIFANTIFLFLILYIGLFVVYLPFPNEEKIWDILDNNFQKSFENYMKPSPHGERATEFWDKIQQKLQCCGHNGPNDYSELLESKPPFSCCIDMNSDCVDEINFKHALRKHGIGLVGIHIYTKGCLDKLVANIFQKFILLQWTFSLYEIVVSLGVVSSIWLTRIYNNPKTNLFCFSRI